MTRTKTCSECGKRKPKAAFGTHQGKCNPCRVKVERRRAGTVKGRANVLLAGARQRARKKSLPFTLSPSDIIPILEAGRCEVTGIRLYLKRNTLRSHPFTPSLDRINPRLGYVPGNVRVVVDIYNRAKSDHTHEAVVVLAKALIEE